MSDYTKYNVDNTGSGRLQESNYRSDSFEKGSSNIYLIIFFACDMRNSMFSLKVLCILLASNVAHIANMGWEWSLTRA